MRPRPALAASCVEAVGELARRVWGGGDEVAQPPDPVLDQVSGTAMRLRGRGRSHPRQQGRTGPWGPRGPTSVKPRGRSGDQLDQRSPRRGPSARRRSRRAGRRRGPACRPEHGHRVGRACDPRGAAGQRLAHAAATSRAGRSGRSRPPVAAPRSGAAPRAGAAPRGVPGDPLRHRRGARRRPRPTRSRPLLRAPAAPGTPPPVGDPVQRLLQRVRRRVADPGGRGRRRAAPRRGGAAPPRQRLQRRGVGPVRVVDEHQGGPLPRSRALSTSTAAAARASDGTSSPGTS